ncbi:MAG: ABC transporter ATP-binding protein [Acidimicrobiia bacterium]
MVSGLSKQYGSLHALAGVDLTVGRGQIVGLIGPNGAGKSTVFRAVTGFERPDGGSVTFAGHRIDRMRPDAIARLGLRQVFQHPHVFLDMSVLGNVMVGAHDRFSKSWLATALSLPRVHREEREIRAAAEQELDFVGVDGAAHADTLTFGQERLMEIARALVAQPQLLLCDEPAAGLNETETSELGTVLDRIRERGIGVLLIEHDMGLVMELCDHIVVLNYGQLIAEGTAAHVGSHPAVIEAYLGVDQAAATAGDQ